MSLALLASQPGCLSTLTSRAARGHANGLLVHSVGSLDEAWFAPGRGLVLCGKVRPGETNYGPEGNPITNVRFAAALPLAELSGSRPPELSYRRFHGTERCDCAATLAGSRRVPVAESPGVQLLNTGGLNQFVRTLEDQRLHVDPLPELGNPPLDFALGPRGAQPAYLVTGAPPVTKPKPPVPDPCADFAATVFPDGG